MPAEINFDIKTWFFIVNTAVSRKFSKTSANFVTWLRTGSPAGL